MTTAVTKGWCFDMNIRKPVLDSTPSMRCFVLKKKKKQMLLLNKTKAQNPPNQFVFRKRIM